MSDNLLNKLAESDVPPMPVSFKREVHDRLNSRLTLMHMADLGLRGVPFAFLHFMQAMLGALAPEKPKRPPGNEEQGNSPGPGNVTTNPTGKLKRPPNKPRPK